MATLTQKVARLSRPIPGFDEPRLRLFDVDEYLAMRDADIFGEDEYLELIGGEILFRHPEVGGPERRPFTNAEYHALAWAGILAPDERVQLVAGDIIVMSPVGSLHSECVDLIDDAFTPLRLVPARADSSSGADGYDRTFRTPTGPDIAEAQGRRLYIGTSRCIGYSAAGRGVSLNAQV